AQTTYPSAIQPWYKGALACGHFNEKATYLPSQNTKQKVLPNKATRCMQSVDKKCTGTSTQFITKYNHSCKQHCTDRDRATRVSSTSHSTTAPIQRCPTPTHIDHPPHTVYES